MDEADRMLEMGFMTILQELAARMPDKEERTTAMFSATDGLKKTGENG